MYRQNDGVAMGSPLGPALANIFVGYHEYQLFKRIEKPPMYYRYVDDTFTIFGDKKDCDEFFVHLNSLHPSLRFTAEEEQDSASLPFLDVLVTKGTVAPITSVYRKPTFTGQYLHWLSFVPLKRKLNLISTLVHRALAICSAGTLQAELNNIRTILLKNGYPDHFIKSVTAKKVEQFSKPPEYGPRKCPVYLHLPWLGSVSARYEKQIKTCVQHCYFAVEPRVVFTTKPILPATKKDVLPASLQSNLIYQFSCHCDSRYVGRTSLRLQQRINQHVPALIRKNQSSQDRSHLSRACKVTNLSPPACDSAIGQHLLNNPSCANAYTDERFSILALGRTAFHLSALEATFIKTSKPNLCKQKEFVYGLKIAH